jgi:Icc protein
MAGNHDRVDTLNEVFQLDEKLTGNALFYLEEVKGLPLIFLDTSKNNLPQKQLDWLVSQSKKIHQDFLLFMHHPPAISGCGFMDRKYPLHNHDEVLSVLLTIDNFKAVLCGHYHTEKTVLIDNLSVFITPSTMMQIAQEGKNYQIISTRPAFRIIDWNGKQLFTTVQFMD